MLLPELYIYRELVKSLTNIEGFNGWFIAKLELKIEKTGLADNKTSVRHIKNRFIKQRKNCSVISACTAYGNTGYELIMYLLKPASMPGGNILKNTFTGCICQGGTYIFKLKYTAEDIKEFTESTGDGNIIHHKAQPVVPGFLMFEDIIKKCIYKDIPDNSTDRYIMVFRNPVFAGEEIEIYNLDNTSRKIIALQAGGFNNAYGKRNTKWEFYGESIYSWRSQELYRNRK